MSALFPSLDIPQQGTQEVTTIGDVLMTVKDVNLSYGNKEILKNINFKIRDVKRPGILQGQIASLVGISGIGKSQLFRILCGFNPIGNTKTKKLSGEVLLTKDQHPVRLGEVGVVPQNYKLLDHRTVRINLMFSGSTKEEVEDYANQFDLTDHLDKFPMELSGGQRQRTSILQQVLTGNQFILLDEPFSGLDEKMLQKTIKLLLKISLLDDFKTLIIISHDIENCLAISDCAFLMTKKGEEGATIEEGNKYNLIERGLAFHDNIKDLSDFRNLLKEIKEKL
jgi:ABC-type nitrate/sulfonate/bicarbonate transport system ATPase subunit